MLGGIYNVFSIWEGNVASEIRMGFLKILDIRLFSFPCKSLIFPLTSSLICIIIGIYDIDV